MTRALLTVVAVLFGGWTLAQRGEPAQQSPRDPIRITAFPEAVFKLSQGASSTTLKLQDEIGGCTTGVYDGSDPQSKPEGGAADTRVIDMLKKGAFWYVTFQATLNSGCNVQGRCGAATSVTLVWLKLDAALRLAARQAIMVEECMTETTMTRWDGKTGNDVQDSISPRISMRGGVLEVVFETTDYIAKVNTVSVLRYDRRAPEKGFVISSKRFTMR